MAAYAVSTRFSELDRATVEQTKLRLVDALGCGIGAFSQRPVEIARRVAPKGNGGTLLGTRKKTSVEMATFVNGLMMRYFDFNDTYLSKEPAHPSDNLAPCLAVSESEDASGKDLLTAAVIAYEIQCRLCDAADLRHRGWDHVNYGLVSTALAASKLMGLDRKKATHAVNISLNGHIAMRQARAGELSMWKGAAFANAARNGVFAARLASEGMTGPSPIFEGEMGFFKQVSGPFELKVEDFGGRGRRFKLNDTYIKYWPAEYHSQSAIWAALEVRKRVADMDRVESVLIETHEAGYTILGKDREKWKPETKETADHSLPFIVGSALLYGKVDNDSYSRKRISDEETLKFLQKIEVREDQTLTALYPAKGIANRITVTLKGGEKVSAEVKVPRGHTLDPMSRDDVEAKFTALTKGILASRRAREALERIWQVEKSADIGELMRLVSAE